MVITSMIGPAHFRNLLSAGFLKIIYEKFSLRFSGMRSKSYRAYASKDALYRAATVTEKR